MIFTNEQAVLDMGATALRFIFAFSITIGFQMVTGGVFQAVGQARAAFILSMSRQILFLIPLLLILPSFWELTGIWLSFTVSDAMGFLLALIYMLKNRSLFLASASGRSQGEIPVANVKGAEPDVSHQSQTASPPGR
jgi:Na+-driven multidrug efflux pump